jgi:hypothetical protein
VLRDGRPHPVEPGDEDGTAVPATALGEGQLLQRLELALVTGDDEDGLLVDAGVRRGW